MEKIISAEQVKHVLQYDRLIDVMQKSLVVFSKKSVNQPVRTVLPVVKEGGYVYNMIVKSNLVFKLFFS